MESISVKGMSCQHCVASVKKALEGLNGVSEVEVNLEKAEATFENSGAARDDIRSAIEKIGFEAGE